jgi:UDP-N-acetylmuramyl pentapeptide synthase
VTNSYIHTEVAKKISEICEYVYLVGNLTRAYVLPTLYQSDLKDVQWFPSNRKAGEYLAKNLPVKAVVLVKGSQNTIFLEESIKYILADKADRKKLCRQDGYWLTIKKQQERLAGV